MSPRADYACLCRLLESQHRTGLLDGDEVSMLAWDTTPAERQFWLRRPTDVLLRRQRARPVAEQVIVIDAADPCSCQHG